MTDQVNDQLQGYLDEAEAELAQRMEQAAPLRQQYEAKAAEIAPLDTEQRAIGAQLKEIEGPIFNLQRRIKGLKTALGHKENPAPMPAEEPQEQEGGEGDPA